MFLLWRFVPSRALLSIPTIRWAILSRFCADLFFYSTTIVLFQQQRGLNFTEIFLMESILSGAVWAADIPTSVWADRVGYHRLLVIGRAINVVGMLIWLFAQGFWLFALSNVLGGLAIACVSGCESALIYSNLPGEMREMQGSAGAAFASLGLASSAGFFLGLLSGSFIGAVSPTLAVAASLIPAALALLAALSLRHHANDGKPQGQTLPEPVRKILRVAWRTIRAQPLLALWSVFRAGAFVLTNAIFWYNQPYFLRVGIPVILFGPFMAAAMALQILLLAWLPLLQRRLGTRLLLVLSCLLPGGAYVLLAASHAPASTVLLVAAVVACSAWREPLVESELNQRIPDASRATTLSALSLFGSLAGVLLNPLIGRLGDLGLETTGIWLGAGLISLCILVPLLTRSP